MDVALGINIMIPRASSLLNTIVVGNGLWLFNSKIKARPWSLNVAALDIYV